MDEIDSEKDVMMIWNEPNDSYEFQLPKELWKILDMTSSYGNIFHVTGPFVRGIDWILVTKANDMELWCFLWSVPEQMVE